MDAARAATTPRGRCHQQVETNDRAHDARLAVVKHSEAAKNTFRNSHSEGVKKKLFGVSSKNDPDSLAEDTAIVAVYSVETTQILSCLLAFR